MSLTSINQTELDILWCGMVWYEPVFNICEEKIILEEGSTTPLIGLLVCNLMILLASAARILSNFYSDSKNTNKFKLMINFIDVLLRVGSVIFSAMNFQRNQNNHSRVEYNCKWIHNNRSNWLPEACYSQKNIDYALSCLDQFTWIGKKWVGNMTKNPAPFKFVDCFLTTNNIDVQQHIPLNEMSKNVALIPLALSLVTVVGYLFRSTFEHSFQKQEDNERNYLNSANDDVQDPITSESPLLEGKKEGNFLFRATSCSHLGHIIELICSLFLIGVASYGIHYLHNNTWRPSAPFQNIYYDTYCSCLYRSGISGFLEFPLQICAFTRTC